MKLTKDDLCLVARTKGWRGGNPTKQGMLDWLQERGVTMTEIMDSVDKMRRAARGELSEKTEHSSDESRLTLDDARRLVDEAITEALQQIKVPKLDEAKIKQLIAEAVTQAQPAKIVLNGDAKPVKLNHRTHPLFEKTMRLVKAGLNILLIGPAGCGKTTLAQHIATALKRSYGTLHCTAGASESQLTGWLLPVGRGKNPSAFTYVPSEFVRLYEGGNSVFLLDELDAADPNMLLVINGALANGSLHVQQRYENPHVARGKNVALMAAANTYGTGADTLYAGRNQLDAATLDRFYIVELGYDAALEADIAGASSLNGLTWKPAPKPDQAELTKISAWITQLRDQVACHRLRRVVSTRTLQKAITARHAGLNFSEIKDDLLSGWTRDELSKLGLEKVL